MKKNSTSGFSLIEIVVALSLFTFIMIMSTTVYIRFLNQNRQTVQVRKLTDQARLLAERIKQDLNNAKTDERGLSLCHPVPYPKVYSQTKSDEILFLDENNICSGYILNSNGVILRGTNLVNNPLFVELTTPDVVVNELNFQIYATQFDTIYPLVDAFFELELRDGTGSPIAVKVSSTILPK